MRELWPFLVPKRASGIDGSRRHHGRGVCAECRRERRGGRQPHSQRDDIRSGQRCRAEATRGRSRAGRRAGSGFGCAEKSWRTACASGATWRARAGRTTWCACGTAGCRFDDEPQSIRRNVGTGNTAAIMDAKKSTPAERSRCAGRAAGAKGCRGARWSASGGDGSAVDARSGGRGCRGARLCFMDAGARCGWCSGSAPRSGSTGARWRAGRSASRGAGRPVYPWRRTCGCAWARFCFVDAAARRGRCPWGGSGCGRRSGSTDARWRARRPAGGGDGWPVYPWRRARGCAWARLCFMDAGARCGWCSGSARRSGSTDARWCARRPAGGGAGWPIDARSSRRGRGWRSG